MLFPIARDAIPDLILYDQHADFFELLAQLLDVIADHAVVNVYVRPMIENVQRAGDVDFKRRRQIVRFGFMLGAQEVVQILKDRHIFRQGICQIILIQVPDAAVDDGLFDRL